MSKTKKGFLPPPKGSGFLPMATKGFIYEKKGILDLAGRICYTSVS